MSHIFLSYKRDERDYVATLANALTRNGYAVWWDFDLAGGDHFDSSIKAAVEAAYVVVVVVTPAGEDSEWMKREQFHAEKLRVPVIPLVREGALWMRLNTLQAIDGTAATLDDPAPDALYAALLKYAPHTLPADLTTDVDSTDAATLLRQLPALIELAEQVKNPTGFAARDVLKKLAALPPSRLSNMAKPAYQSLPPLPHESYVRPGSTPRTPRAAVTPGDPVAAVSDSPAQRRRFPIFAALGALIVIAAALAVFVPLLLNPGKDSTPTPVTTQKVAAQLTAASSPTVRLTLTLSQTPKPATVQPTLTLLTATLSNKPTSTNTAMPPTEITIDPNALALTLDFQDMQTAAAQLTGTSTNWTKTPTATSTHTPDAIGSANAIRTEHAVATQTQNMANLTATATRWTLTPTTTPTPVPTVTMNSQWTPQLKSFDGVNMALVPPGCFKMGSNNGFGDELPVTSICFSKPFWIDKTEITQGQFGRLGGKAAHAPLVKGDEHPVEDVTWLESVAFCEQRDARLPNEAEWEYAARGPDNMLFTWGSIFDSSKLIWNSVQASDVDRDNKRGGASWVGAVDMLGNVWEWVSSQHRSYPYSATDGRENTDNITADRVLRGGAFITVSTSYLRASNRNSVAPTEYNSSFGFRCARDFS